MAPKDISRSYASDGAASFKAIAPAGLEHLIDPEVVFLDRPSAFPACSALPPSRHFCLAKIAATFTKAKSCG